MDRNCNWLPIMARPKKTGPVIHLSYAVSKDKRGLCMCLGLPVAKLLKRVVSTEPARLFTYTIIYKTLNTQLGKLSEQDNELS